MKSIEWTPADGEDMGKVFIITRMSAFAADKWACHVVRSLVRAGAKVPDSALEGGMISLTGSAVQIFGEMSDDDCDKAFEGLMACCQIKRSPNAMPSKIIDADIQDARTIFNLRVEAFKLHVDFFKAAAAQISPLAAAIMGALPAREPVPPTSPE